MSQIKSQSSTQSLERSLERSQIATTLNEKFLKVYKHKVPHKKGVVFIGNSRIGKSTLSLMLKGVEVQVKFSEGDDMLRIEPKCPQLRKNQNVIRHIKTSVTEFPNIYETEIDGKYYSLVDLPGFRDTSYQKQICNWYYIQNILADMDQILFVMVISVHEQLLKIGQDEIQMMHRFAQAFPQKPNVFKQNIVIIVNFTENIHDEQQQHIPKSLIRKNILDQLKNKKLDMFYMKSFQDSRMLLFPKITTNNPKYSSVQLANQNLVLDQSKLVRFFKKNISRIGKTELSIYKINLTQQMSKKSQNLKSCIVEMCEQIIENLKEKFELPKQLFSRILQRLSQTEGYTFTTNDSKQLSDYYERKKLFNYEEIDKWNNLLFQEKDEKSSLEDIVIEIVKFFGQMSQIKVVHFKTLEEILDKIKQFYKRFFQLMNGLEEIVFQKSTFRKLEKINETILISVMVNAINLSYLNNGISDFNVADVKKNINQSFIQKNMNSLLECFSDSIIKVSTFKPQLKVYLENFNKKISTNLMIRKKYGIETYKKLTQISGMMNFKQLKKQFGERMNKSGYEGFTKILSASGIVQKIEEFKQMEKLLANTKEDDRKQIQKWKSESPQWILIKNKSYTTLLTFLFKNQYNYQELIKFYLKLSHNFQQLVQILEIVCKQAYQQQIDKSIAYKLCLQVAQHLKMHCQFTKTQQCYGMAEKLVVYEDRQKFIQIKLKKAQVWKMTQTLSIYEDYEKKVQKEPWNDIKDNQYYDLIEIVQKYSRKLIENQKKQTQLSKSFSNLSNSFNSPRAVNHQTKNDRISIQRSSSPRMIRIPHSQFEVQRQTSSIEQIASNSSQRPSNTSQQRVNGMQASRKGFRTLNLNA